MPLLMALIGNKWTWIALVIGALGVAWTIQTARLDNAKADLKALRGEYETFKARVAAEGKIAQEKADKQAATDRQRKEKADEAQKRTVSLLNQRISSLRHDADSSGRYLLPAAAPGAADPTRACFDRAEFERANRAVLGDLRAIADKGDAAVTDLNAARNWAHGVE